MTMDCLSSSAVRPPAHTPFPYTTLFRSQNDRVDGTRHGQVVANDDGVPAFFGCPPSRPGAPDTVGAEDRKSTRLNSSHRCISYAVFCLKKKKKKKPPN